MRNIAWNENIFDHVHRKKGEKPMAQKTKLKKKVEEVRVSHVGKKGNHPLLKARYQNWLDFNFRVQSKPIQNLF